MSLAGGSATASPNDAGTRDVVETLVDVAKIIDVDLSGLDGGFRGVRQKPQS